jgi:hypothetical protein
MEIRIDLSSVSRMLSILPDELDKAASDIMVDVGRDMEGSLSYYASKLGNYPGGGKLAERGTTVTTTKRRVSIKPAPGYIRQISLLEHGPSTNYPKTFYLSEKHPKLKKWALDRLDMTEGKITIGGEGTKFGKPSHQFMTNAKLSTMSRLDRMVIENIKNIGGK